MLTMPEFAQFLKTRYTENNCADLSWVNEFETMVSERNSTLMNDGWVSHKNEVAQFLLKNFDAIVKACNDTSVEARKANEFYTRLKIAIEHGSSSDLGLLFVKNVTQANKI